MHDLRLTLLVVGRMCTCGCGVINAVHPCSVLGSGNVMVEPTAINRSRVHPMFPALTLDAQDSNGFFGAPTPIPYQAQVVSMTNRPTSRFAMEYFINLPGGVGQVLTVAQIRTIFLKMVEGLSL